MAQQWTDDVVATIAFIFSIYNGEGSFNFKVFQGKYVMKSRLN